MNIKMRYRWTFELLMENGEEVFPQNLICDLKLPKLMGWEDETIGNIALTYYDSCSWNKKSINAFRYNFRENLIGILSYFDGSGNKIESIKFDLNLSEVSFSDLNYNDIDECKVFLTLAVKSVE